MKSVKYSHQDNKDLWATFEMAIDSQCIKIKHLNESVANAELDPVRSEESMREAKKFFEAQNKRSALFQEKVLDRCKKFDCREFDFSVFRQILRRGDCSF